MSYVCDSFGKVIQNLWFNLFLQILSHPICIELSHLTVAHMDCQALEPVSALATWNKECQQNKKKLFPIFIYSKNKEELFESKQKLKHQFSHIKKLMSKLGH